MPEAMKATITYETTFFILGILVSLAILAQKRPNSQDDIKLCDPRASLHRGRMTDDGNLMSGFPWLQ